MLNVSSKEVSKPSIGHSWLWRKTHLPGENLGPPAWVVFITLLIFLVAEIIISPLLVYIGHNILRPHSPLDFTNSVGAQFAYILIAETFLALAVIYIVKRRGLNLRIIGLGRRPVPSDFWRAGLAFIAFIAVVFMAGLILNAFSPDLYNQKQDVGFKVLHSKWETIMAFVALVLLPPLGEETLFRGYLYSGLRKFWHLWPALLFTSLVFGAGHLFTGDTGLLWAAGLDTFLLSIFLVYLRDKTGALYAGMVVHMLNNLLAFFVVIK